jgi:sterol regulatory element-binding transcription factor 1
MLSVDLSEYQSNKISPGRKSSGSKRSRPPPPPAPVHLHKLIKKPEPIPVTFDQFQALLCSVPDTSTSNVGSFSSLLENSTIIGNNIPLKIVNQPNNMNNNNNSSDENSRHDSPTNSHSNINFGNGGRVRRKSSHNAIEKRYRSSINERILELKEIVADTDEKVG